MILHFSPERKRAVCGIMPLWSSNSWTNITCSACLEKRPTKSLDAALVAPAEHEYLTRAAELPDAPACGGAQVACACGHLWLSHNDNGCCWDDECQCTRAAANANR